MVSNHNASEHHQAHMRDRDSLLDGLASRDSVVREQTITAFVQLGEPAIPFLVDALHDIERWYTAVETLVRIGQPAVEPLIGVLNQASIDVFAFEALYRIGEPAVPALLAALHHPSRNVRSWVISVLGEIGDMRAIAPLQLARDDPDAEIRRSATRALERIKGLP
jgi:HEAT repeat protein